MDLATKVPEEGNRGASGNNWVSLESKLGLEASRDLLAQLRRIPERLQGQK